MQLTLIDPILACMMMRDSGAQCDFPQYTKIHGTIQVSAAWFSLAVDSEKGISMQPTPPSPARKKPAQMTVVKSCVSLAVHFKIKSFNSGRGSPPNSCVCFFQFKRDRFHDWGPCNKARYAGVNNCRQRFRGKILSFTNVI